MHLYDPSRFRQVPAPHVLGFTAHSLISEFSKKKPNQDRVNAAQT